MAVYAQGHTIRLAKMYKVVLGCTKSALYCWWELKTFQTTLKIHIPHFPVIPLLNLAKTADSKQYVQRGNSIK